MIESITNNNYIKPPDISICIETDSNILTEQVEIPDFSNKEILKQKSDIKILDLFKQSNIVQSETNILSGKFKYEGDEELKALQALQKIRRNIKYAQNNIHENVVNDLVSSGLSLNKISFKILHAVMKECKGKDMNEKEIDTMVDDIFKENDIPVSDKTSKLIEENYLPTTTSNINNLNSLVEKFNSVSDFNDNCICALLSSNKEISLDNLYIYKSFKNKDTSKMDDTTLDSLKSEIEKTMTANSIELNEENEEISKLLVKNEIPLTKENVSKVLFLRNLDKVNENNLLNIGIKAIKNDVNFGEINLYKEINSELEKEDLLNNYNESISILPTITDINIYSLLQNGHELTLNNFKNLRENLNITHNNFDEKIVSTKKQLLELQQKLTYESIYRLSSKNLDINTLEINKALKILNESENSVYESNLRIMEAPVTTENLNKMSNLFNIVSSFNSISTNFHNDILNKRVTFTIKNIGDYENLATSVNSKYGDSFKKVEEQIPDFLKNIDVEPTKENIKAFTILSKNNCEVSAENILQTNIIDQKINKISTKLYPNIVAQMLKEELDPLSMPINDVIDYIDRFNEVLGKDLSGQISAHILKMDESKTVKKEDRDSIMSIYKALNSVTKNNYAALSENILNEKNLTIKNLLDVSNKYNTNNEKDLISDSSFIYNKNNIEQIVDIATPDILESLIKKNKDYTDTTVEQLKEQIETIIKNKNYDDSNISYHSRDNMEMIHKALNCNPETFIWMENNNIPITLQNIIQSQFILKEKNYLSKQLDEINNDVSLEKSILDKELTLLKNENLDLLSDVYNVLEDYKDITNESKILDKVSSVQNLINIQKQINKNGNSITLPIKLHDKISNLNMYVINENIKENEDLNIFMELNTTNLNTVSVLAKINNNKISLKFNGEKKSMEYLENNKDKLVEFVKDSGFEIDNISFT